MAQTLKFGSGTWATKKGSTLAYNDEGGNFKPLPFTYTGAGKGTRVNKEGLIEVVENDRPRIDYLDSEDGVFLLEKAATNLITYSEDFSQWVQTRVTNTDNETTSPDGSLNASLITEDATLNSKYTFLNLSTTTNEHSLSFFAKYKGRYLQVLFGTNDVSGNPYINFDLQNGTFDNNGVSNPSIEDFGNGWYKCSLSVTPTVTSDFGVLFSPIQSFTSSRLISYQGDGTSGVYIYGAQLESGNASSYIPTQGTIQTRVQETASGSGNSEVFNSEQGVLFADIAANANDGTNRFISISNGTSTNYISLYYSVGSNILKITCYDGTNIITFTKDNFTITNYLKIVLKYKANDFSLWINGFEVDTSVINWAMPLNTLDRINLSHYNKSLPFYGSTKEISYYDEILTDLELETLTSYRTWEAMVKELNLNIIHNE